LEEHDSIDLRSKAFQDVMGEPPNWLLRWGITAIFIAFLSLFVVGYFLEYPETVTAPVRLETSNPPEEIYAPVAGRLIPNFKEQTAITQDTVLGQISNLNSGTAEQILSLGEMLNDNDKKGFVTLPDFKKLDSWDLGPVKGDYLKFYQAFNGIGSSNLAQNQTINTFDENIKIYRNDIKEFEKIISEKLARLKEIPDRRDKLKAAYSKSKSSDDNLNLTALYQEETRLKEEIKVHRQLISDKEREIINQENQKSLIRQGVKENKTTREQNIAFAISNLKSKIEEWKINHIIKSPITGTLVYQDKLKGKGTSFNVEKGEKLFAIIPTNAEQEIEGKLYLSSEESLKIKEGQEVKIKISTYKPSKYGLLNGVVIDKATLPVNGQYLIRVDLPNGMKTTKSKDIPFEHQMQGEAQIITQNRNFTGLIWDQFVEMLHR